MIRKLMIPMLLFVLAVPALAAGEASFASRNYDVVFHAKLGGQAEEIAMTISEGHFSISMGEPRIEISGTLEVSEDFMHRMEYRFGQEIQGDAEGESRYFERSGSVVLEPGETVRVVEGPDVRLAIELKKNP